MPGSVSEAMSAVSSPGLAGSGLLHIEGVRVILSGREVLQDVSFDLRRGELTGLIGANGAGKTTLLRVVLGLQRVEGGKVELVGQTGRRRAIGYVPQKLVLDPDLPMR
ncbi:MAG: ATP-binding cassette domain-containing protein, partial [Acidimicrobiales bacterium]